jgi:hypothetical protein
MKLDQSAHEAEAEPRTLILPRVIVAKLRERPPDAGEFLVAHADARIADTDRQPAFLMHRLQRDPAAFRREFDRVGKQVVNHLFYFPGIGFHHSAFLLI